MSFTPYEVAMAEAEEERWLKRLRELELDVSDAEANLTMARNDLKRAKRMYPEHYPNV